MDMERLRERKRGRRSGHLPGRLIPLGEYDRLGIEGQKPLSTAISLSDQSYETMERHMLTRLNSTKSDPELVEYDKTALIKKLKRNASSYRKIFEAFKANDLEHNPRLLADLQSETEFDSLYGPLTKIMRAETARLAKIKASIH